MTDKELVRRANVRFKRLEKENIENDALNIFKHQINIFYQGRKSLKTSKSGISITQKMTTQQRKTMRQIIRSFMRDSEEPNDIKKRYQEKFEKYIDGVKTPSEKVTTGTMSKRLQALDRILIDREINKIYSSDQVKAVYDHQKTSGISTSNYRKALVKLIIESGRKQGVKINKNDIIFKDKKMSKFVPLNNMTSDEIIDTVIEYAREYESL